jgi:hypothetical protein
MWRNVYSSIFPCSVGHQIQSNNTFRCLLLNILHRYLKRLCLLTLCQWRFSTHISNVIVTIFQATIIMKDIRKWQIWSVSSWDHLNQATCIHPCLILRQQQRQRVNFQMKGEIQFILPWFSHGTFLKCLFEVMLQISSSILDICVPALSWQPKLCSSFGFTAFYFHWKINVSVNCKFIQFSHLQILIVLFCTNNIF